MADGNDVQTGGQPPLAECKSLIIVNASVQAGLDAASSQYIGNNLNVNLADGGRYRTAVEATRAVVLNAAKSREKKQSDEVNKRKAPKL